MSTLITGSGLIAAHVGHELQSRAEDIVIYSLDPSSQYLETVLDIKRVQIFEGDITTLPEIISIVQRHKVTTIVHTAGLIGSNVSRQPYRGIEVNVGGSIAVMEAARISGVTRIIFCSSMAIYDFNKIPSYESITEDCPPGPKNLYGATKLASEYLLNQYGDLYGIEVVNLRLAATYGRGQYLGGSWMGRIINRLLEAALTDKPVVIRPEWLGINEYLYVKDAARAIALAVLSPKVIGGPYNIGTGKLDGFTDLIAEIKHAVPKARIQVEEARTPTVSYLEREQAFDISKAQTHLGYKPEFSLRKGLEDYLQELQRFSGYYYRLE